jgi:hypothetical protein
MRFLYAIAVLACSAFALFAANDPPMVKGQPPAVIEVGQGTPVTNSLASSSVYISVDLGNGATGGGTGTVIHSEGGRNLVLTNAHVVESDLRPISITYWCDRKPYISPATYIGGSSVSHVGPGEIRVNGPDLAILMLDIGADLSAVDLADSIPAVGTPVQLYGFGGAGVHGTQPLHKTGRVLPDPGWVEPATKTSIATVNGDSGSGIFNEAGQLVAVHWGGGAVRLDTVHTFTVKTLERRGIFQRFKDRLTARRISKAVSEAVAVASAKAAAVVVPVPPAVKKEPAASPKSSVPSAAANPFTIPSHAAGSSCPGGVCQPTVTYSRGVFRRR